MEISFCDCDWLDEGSPVRPCGCESHDVRLYRDAVYHYAGHHWRADCLIHQLARERDELKRRVEELEGERRGAVR